MVKVLENLISFLLEYGIIHLRCAKLDYSYLNNPGIYVLLTIAYDLDCGLVFIPQWVAFCIG